MTRLTSKNRPRSVSARSGSVRIIAGKWRRRRLKLDDQQDLRPTPDRVRETLFSWLTPVLRGRRCLALFAGRGALGFEAASRGAKQVTMVEHDSVLVAMLEKHRDLLSATEVRVVRGDAIQWLDAADTAFDIIFLDPPFGKYDLGGICNAIEMNGLIAPLGFIYLETSVNAPTLMLPQTWESFRSQRAGQVRYDLAVRNSPGAIA